MKCSRFLCSFFIIIIIVWAEKLSPVQTFQQKNRNSVGGGGVRKRKALFGVLREEVREHFVVRFLLIGAIKSY